MTRRHPEAGFSLAEVVVALGLLAGVLISVAGLLVLGNRQVDAGRSSTEALSIARDILEEVAGWSFRHTYELLDCDDTSSICIVDSTEPAAQVWQEQVERSLTLGRAAIRIDALDAPSLAQSRTLRITVTVFWRDGLRSRSVRLATVRA